MEADDLHNGKLFVGATAPTLTPGFAAPASFPGLVSRQQILQRCGLERLRSQQVGSTYALLALDVDGCALPSALAHGLLQQLRHTDCCAHWGATAFLVLLADADLATAQLVAQRLLDGVRCQGPAPRSGWLNLRLSIGVAKASGGDRFTVID